VDDYPQLTIPFGILDDCGFGDGKIHPRIAGHLFQAAVFIFCTIYTKEEIFDESSFFDNQSLFLANALSQQADQHLRTLFRQSSLFWEYHQQFWTHFSEAELINQEIRSRINISEGNRQAFQHKDLLAPYKLIPGAALLLTDRESDLPQLFSALDNLHRAILILLDLTNLKRDLKLRKITYPILKILEEVEAPTSKAYNPQGAYMAIMMMDIPSKLIQECLENLNNCRVTAKMLGLNKFLPLVDNQEIRALKIKEQFLQPKKSVLQGSEYSQKGGYQGSLSLDEVGIREKVLKMAEGFLLSDLTFKESWEVHRHGMAGLVEVISRFPAGLIIELLCLHGFDMSSQVEDFCTYFRESNFSYYNHPDLPYADTDTLGVLLRLYRYSKNQDAHKHDLEKPLEWMQKSVDKTGRIPVWIYPQQKKPNSAKQSIRLLGESCGTIEAKLLIGLIDFDWECYQEIIQKSAYQLLSRFIQQGTGITVNYPSRYCLWRIKQLSLRLKNLPIQAKLQTLIDQVFDIYTDQLRQEINSYYLSPQKAAFLILAGIDSPAQQLNYNRWGNILLKNQHSDGGWNGDPLFFVPNRGGSTTWYTSRTLTSAFCYHALRTYKKVKVDLGT
jgi:hypothetical protein